MSNTNNVVAVKRTLVLWVLIGAVIALAVILTFVMGVDDPKPEWHRTWWIRPLVITPLAGAAGGLFFHWMYDLERNSSWKKVVFTFLGIAGYVVALWLGIVLGLAGTLWD